MKLGLLAMMAGGLALAAARQIPQPSALRLVQTIALPNVEGRIDHLGIDVKGQRLFVAVVGNDTMEILDLRANKWLARIPGLAEPQGVFFVPRENRIFVANGEDGSLRIFDGTSYELLNTERFSGDADNVRYDATKDQIYVGYGDGALAILDASTGRKLADIPLP